MDNDSRYTPIDAIAPTFPAVKRTEILKHYLRLVRVFGGKEHIPVGVLENRGGRPIRSNRTRCGFGWASSKPTTGHHRGWGRMIHDASHYVFENRHPHARPHDGGHAKLEREMMEYVIGHRMFEPKPEPKKATPTDKLSAVEIRLERWETKASRAARAIKKLQATRRRLLKRHFVTST